MRQSMNYGHLIIFYTSKIVCVGAVELYRSHDYILTNFFPMELNSKLVNDLVKQITKVTQPGHLQKLENYENALKELRAMEVAPLAITLDWLSLYYTQPDNYIPKLEPGESQEINQSCYLVGLDGGTVHFNKRYMIVYQGQECATLLFDSKIEKFIKKDVVKVDYSNHTLYTGDWQDIHAILIAYGLLYKGASRIDIAIDGVNYLHKLMNIYAKQTANTLAFKLKNSSQHRARFSAKILNTETLNFENFNIGAGGNYSKKHGSRGSSAGSTKMITIYNKSLEIVKSGKSYIQDWWAANGVVQKVVDLDRMSKILEDREEKGEEVFSIKEMQTIYRFEIRLKSKAIAEIKNFDIEMLCTPSGLASIVKLHCKKFFEAYFKNDVNTTRCKSFDLLPYEKLGATALEKIPRIEADGLYKAKLTIHSIVYDSYVGKINDDKANEMLDVIKDKCNEYQLHKYVLNKLEEWSNKYSKATKQERLIKVGLFMNRLENWCLEFADEDIVYLSAAHNQAMATASFGD